MKNIFTKTIILTLLLHSASVTARESIRQGKAKQCYISCYGKGPSWFTDISFEIEMWYCKKNQPIIDSRIFDPSPKAVSWTEKIGDQLWKEPQINEVARVNGRKVVEVVYRQINGHTMDINLVFFETKAGSGWFSPFFIASVDTIHPEAFSGCIISGRDISLGYLATLRYSGTGSSRSHRLFHLLGNHPQEVAKVSTGRVRKSDFDSEKKYKKALETREQEIKLYKGILK